MKLSKAQNDLLDAIKGGVRVYYMPGINTYYFRGDTHKNCTNTVLALLNRKLVEEVDSNVVILTEAKDTPR